ncbi:Pentatricopeptide repeat-containing protein [Artemisia annua]|uniref:Pentatricopeptide repeat-containing protein n=1 Tax=Artemisia annua TaxID=35608 RepID=A0A2U1KSK6_ARTAN|nr:Pentatricopeptide repeat-containing protein [Artemisia annua]
MAWFQGGMSSFNGRNIPEAINSSVLSACTHAGMIKEGSECFLSMTRDFNIRPEIEHYGCMVDLLCKAGLLEDTLGMIRDMRMEPNAVIWSALLGGCKLQKNLEIAEIAVSISHVNKLMIMKPDNMDITHF